MECCIRILRLPILLAALAGTAAHAAGFNPDRRALFVTILEENDCEMNNYQPAPGILDAIETHGFTRDEVRAIAKDILASGDGVRQGENLVLKTGSCS